MDRSFLRTFFSLFFILSCWTPSLIGANLSLEDKLQQLETTLQATVKQLQEKIIQLEDKAAHEKAKNAQLELEIRQNVIYCLESHYN